MTEPALYEREGDGFVGTVATTGGWSPDAQSGGAVLALLGHVIEDIDTLAPMSVSRLTADFVRPVPVGERLRIDHEIVREGKKIQVVDLTVTSAHAEHVRARVLRIRDADMSGTDGAPASTTDQNPAATMPEPEELVGMEGMATFAEFLRTGVDFRRTDPAVHDVSGIWLRLRVPVVAGEPVRATSRVTVPMDLVNLIGVQFTSNRFTAINPDVNAHVLRPPVGEWIALVGGTHFDYGNGHGVSTATMSDAQGFFGLSSTSQVVQARQ